MNEEESKDTVFKELLDGWEDGWAGVDEEMSTDIRGAERRRSAEKKDWEDRWGRAIGDHQ
jgi:hypothetical protein